MAGVPVIGLSVSDVDNWGYRLPKSDLLYKTSKGVDLSVSPPPPLQNRKERGKKREREEKKKKKKDRQSSSFADVSQLTRLVQNGPIGYPS